MELSELVSEIGISPDVQRLIQGSRLVGGNTVTVKVAGLAELETALTQLPEKIAKGVLVSAMTEATEAFRARAQELAPYDPDKKAGMHLIDGIKKQMRIGSHSIAGSWVHGKIALHPDVFYGRYIEFGWTTPQGRKVDAQPFMRPAWDETNHRALAIISQRLAAGIAAAAQELHR